MTMTAITQRFISIIISSVELRQSKRIRSPTDIAWRDAGVDGRAARVAGVAQVASPHRRRLCRGPRYPLLFKAKHRA